MPRLFPLAALLAVALPTALSGCSGGAEAAVETERTVTLALAGAPGMNAGGNAAVLVVYQLSDADPFTLIPVEEFWLGDEEAYSGSLVSKREILLYPGEVRAVPLVLDARTTYVGVAADFRAPSLDGWRAAFPVTAIPPEGLGVMVGDDALSLTGPAPEEPAPAAPADTTAAGR